MPCRRWWWRRHISGGIKIVPRQFNTGDGVGGADLLPAQTGVAGILYTPGSVNLVADGGSGSITWHCRYRGPWGIFDRTGNFLLARLVNPAMLQFLLPCNLQLPYFGEVVANGNGGIGANNNSHRRAGRLYDLQPHYSLFYEELP